MWLFVERKLEEEARKGAFDRLPGPGGPIDLSENPYVPPEWRLGFKLLKDHGVVPEFVQRRKEIETLREELGRVPRSQTAVARAVLERLKAAVEALNACLAREREFVRTSLQLPPVDVETELRASGHGP